MVASAESQEEEDEEHSTTSIIDVAVAVMAVTSESIIRDDVDETHIRNLPSHLRCHITPQSGRTITTRVPIQKGTTFFQEQPFAHAIHFLPRKSTCDNCFAQLAPSDIVYFDDSNTTPSISSSQQTALEFPCKEGCGVHYCTEACREQSFMRHARICHLIQQTNDTTTNGKKHARYMNEALSLLIALSSNPRPLEEVMIMMVDDYTKKGDRDTARAEREFRALVHCLETEGKILEAPGAYAAALSIKNLNGIGIYNAYGEEVAVALCPVLAMVNHSCAPNCQQFTQDGSCQLRALRDIDVGEELNYSYISLDSTDSERKTAIEENWKFTCKCYRCAGGDCQTFDAAHTCYCGAVCYDVDRTSGECVCNTGKVINTNTISSASACSTIITIETTS